MSPVRSRGRFGPPARRRRGGGGGTSSSAAAPTSAGARIPSRTATCGVVVPRRAPGVRVEPRVVTGLDENRLTGYAGLPVARNLYLERLLWEPVLVAGALSPLPGEYAVVFDSAARAGAG